MKQTVKAAVGRCERFASPRVYSYTFKRSKAPWHPVVYRAGVVLV